MYSQAKKISSWGDNVYVKIPVMNTKGENSYNLIKKLSQEKVKLNITAVFNLEQVQEIINHLEKDSLHIFLFLQGG